MSGFTVDFEFELGELVYLRSASHTDQARPTQKVIVERIAQECTAGVQKTYRVSGDAGFYHEIVLCRGEPEYRERSKESLRRMVQEILEQHAEAREPERA